MSYNGCEVRYTKSHRPHEVFHDIFPNVKERLRRFAPQTLKHVLRIFHLSMLLMDPTFIENETDDHHSDLELAFNAVMQLQDENVRDDILTKLCNLKGDYSSFAKKVRKYVKSTKKSKLVWTNEPAKRRRKSRAKKGLIVKSTGSSANTFNKKDLFWMALAFGSLLVGSILIFIWILSSISNESSQIQNNTEPRLVHEGALNASDNNTRKSSAEQFPKLNVDKKVFIPPRSIERRVSKQPADVVVPSPQPNDGLPSDLVQVVITATQNITNITTTQHTSSHPPFTHNFTRTDGIVGIMSRKQKVFLYIDSFVDYIWTVQPLDENKDISLHISIVKYNDWKVGTVMRGAHKISRLMLEGPFSVDVIVDILRQAYNLEKLAFVNTNDTICLRNIGQLSLLKQIGQKVPLYTLTGLTTVKFTSCPELYEFFSEYLLIPSVKYFGITSGIVDSSNIVFVQELMLKANNTLLGSTLDEVNCSLNVFENFPPLPFLKNLTLVQNCQQISSNSGPSRFGVNTLDPPDIHKKFQKLQILDMNGCLVRWRSMGSVMKSESLRYLNIGTFVTKNTFNLTFLKSALPGLKTLILTLYFQKCDETHELHGIEHIPDRLKNLRVRSNCKLVGSSTVSLVKRSEITSYIPELRLHVIDYNIKR